MRIRVLMVDDHEMFAESVARVLNARADMVVVGVAGTAVRAVELARTVSPDVAVVDFHLPDGEGPQTVTKIREASPQTRVLMLTGDGGGRMLVSAIEAGCSGFLTKGRAVSELVEAVQTVHAGGSFIPPDLLPTLMRNVGHREEKLGDDLTPRELEVLTLLAQGLTNAQISERWGLSVNTVRNHVQSMLEKLAVHSQLEAVAIALRAGLIEPPH